MKRTWKRRLVNLVLATTAVSGGSAGVYYWRTSDGAAPAQPADMVIAPVADASNDGFPYEMSANDGPWLDSETVDVQPADSTIDEMPDRYANDPTVPVTLAPTPDDTPAEPSPNEPESRYAASESRYSETPAEPAARETLARGQGPAPPQMPPTPANVNTNPFDTVSTQTPSQPSSAAEDRARAAFAGDAAQLAEGYSGNLARQPEQDPYAAQLQQAQAPAPLDGRYGAATPPQPIAQNESPIADYANDNRRLPLREPAAIPQPDPHLRAAAPAVAAPVAPSRPRAAQDPYANQLGRSAMGDPTATGNGRPGERGLEGPQAPSLLVEKFAPEGIQVGKPCRFQLRIKNTGRMPAHDVEIHDQIPEGTELLSTTPEATIRGGDVHWSIGTLAIGEEATLEMHLRPTDEGNIGSVAKVTFAAEASAAALSTRPELRLELSAGKQVMVGEQHTVKVRISNPGSGDATGVMLLENVPEQLSHAAGPTLEYEVGTLRAGESRELDLVLTAEQPAIVENRMTIRGDAGLEQEASVTFEVIAPDLQVELRGPNKRYLERRAEYEVKVHNPGTASAEDIQLVTHLPKGLRFVSANNLGEYDAATHSVYWSLRELPAKESGRVRLVTLPVEPGNHKLEVAGTASQGLEARTEKPVRIEGVAAINFTVTDSDDPIEIDGETTYDIRVENKGSKDATDVQVVVKLVGQLRAISADGKTSFRMGERTVRFEPLKLLAPGAEADFRVRVQGQRAGNQMVQVEVSSEADPDQTITKEESTRVYADE